MIVMIHKKITDTTSPLIGAFYFKGENMKINYDTVNGVLCLTKKGFIRVTGVPLGTLDTWINRHKILTFKLGNTVLISKDEVDKYLTLFK